MADEPTTNGPRPTIWWVRRDFRLHDNPALGAAVHDGSAVLPVFVLDQALLAKAGPVRTAWMHAALTVLDADLREWGGPGLSIVRGKPINVIPRLAREVDASAVHVSADFGPYGRRRDERVADALAGRDVAFTATGSPYAVAPGTLMNGSGKPFQVFTPFHRAWTDRGVHGPAPNLRPADVDWLTAENRAEVDADPKLVKLAGEEAATRSWHRWLEADSGGVADYARLHDDPGADATSHLSIALRWGHLHPRTLLADLGSQRSKGPAALARQLAWRDFFADVLFHRPDAVTAPIRARVHHNADRRAGEQQTGGVSARGLAAGQDGLSAGRRRDAPVARGGLDAQPGPDGRGVLPDQGPAHRLVARRAVVHGPVARRRHRPEPAQLAVGGRLRD